MIPSNDLNFKESYLLLSFSVFVITSTGLGWLGVTQIHWTLVFNVLFTDFGVSNSFLPVGVPDLASYPPQVRISSSFFEYVIYYSYKISLWNFERLRSAVAELFKIRGDFEGYSPQVWILARFFYFFKYIIYYSYKIILQSFKRLRLAVMELFLIRGDLASYPLQVRILAQSWHEF